MREKRGNWHLLTGLIIGALIGLMISVVMMPVKYVDTEPFALEPGDRDVYRGLIARAYLVEADNGRAFARLEQLGDVSAADALVAQAQMELGAGSNETESRALALLAVAVKENSLQITPLPRVLIDATAIPTATATIAVENTPTGIAATRTPAVTITPRPTITPQPTQGAPYELVEQTDVCDPELQESLIQVYVYNKNEKPVAGVRIEISVPDGGVEGFYTGLYPEISLGYADYAMVEGMIYNLRVGEAGQLIQNLSIPQCESDEGSKYPGSIQLIFKKPQ